MKPILTGLALASLLNAGCITFPTGHHPWRQTAKQGETATAPAKTALPKAQPVNPEEVNEDNVRQKAHQLESEIRGDELTPGVHAPVPGVHAPVPGAHAPGY